MQATNAVDVDRFGRPAAMPNAVWIAAAAAANAVAGQVVFALGIGAAMVLVLALDLGQASGSSVYMVAIGFVVATHAALIHIAVRTIGRHASVPWLIWPAMLVYPAAIIGTAVLGTGVIEAFPGMVALLSVAMAFVSLGKQRWSA